MTTIAQALQAATRRLMAHETPRLDAEVLLVYVLEKPRSHLHAWPEEHLSDNRLRRFEALVERRAKGEPVAHITGYREFWSLPLKISPDTLIPRPDTETLVEQALAVLPNKPALTVADLGTGSGAIALALARERPHWRVIALDQSPAAIDIARQNAQRLLTTQPIFIVGHWCDSFARASLDAIVTNPPYVCSADPHLQSGDLRFEPQTALASGADGLDAIREIVERSVPVLKPAGWLLVEHAPEQTQNIHKLLINDGFLEPHTALDLAGQERVTRARRAG